MSAEPKGTQNDLFEARARRDDGIARAEEHADAVEESWTDRAYAHLQAFARDNRLFTAEDVRHDADLKGFPKPPDGRAWGGCFAKASRAGIIVREGFTVARDPKVHCSYMAIWRSNARPAE